MAWRDRDVDEPDGLEARPELGERQSARDAADVGAALGALRRRQVVLGDDVGDAHAAARAENPRDLAEHSRLVGSEVDHAVADHHIDRLRGKRNVLDVAADEFDVRDTGLGSISLGERQHLVGHVETDRPAGRPDALRGEEDVDPAAGSEVEDALALMEFGDRDRIAAAERGEDRRLRELGAFERGVELRADRLRLTGAAPTRVRPIRGSGVSALDLFPWRSCVRASQSMRFSPSPASGARSSS